MNTEIFSTYFENCSTLKISGRTFPVKISYVDEIINMINFKSDAGGGAHNDRFVNLQLVLALIKHIHSHATVNDSVLVFLPGIDTIGRLKELIEENLDLLQIKILHSEVCDADQKAAFERTNHGRKIILATNIAETSVTIPDVAYVIDCGKVKTDLNFIPVMAEMLSCKKP